MIHAVLFNSLAGYPIIDKWYFNHPSMDNATIRDAVLKHVHSRSPRLPEFTQFQNFKVIYKTKKDVLFIFLTDLEQNEMEIMCLIDLILSCCSAKFKGITASQMVKKMDVIDSIISMVIVGGEINETSELKIIRSLTEQEE